MTTKYGNSCHPIYGTQYLSDALMTTQHTPGPWTFRRSATPDAFRQYRVYPEDSGNDIAVIYDCDQSEANAQLIAAAPETARQRDELLEACKTLLLETGRRARKSNLRQETALNQARAAIARAGGAK
jgi:hypothetical protein